MKIYYAAPLFNDTDTRALDYTGDDNLMIEGCMNFKIARSLEELENMLNEI